MTLLPNEHLIQVELNVQNAGLSDMATPYEVLIRNENVEIMSDHAPGNSRLFQVGPLKARTNYNLPMVLKIRDGDVDYAKEFELKRDGIEIDFKMNAFGNVPDSSLTVQSVEEPISTG